LRPQAGRAHGPARTHLDPHPLPVQGRRELLVLEPRRARREGHRVELSKPDRRVHADREPDELLQRARRHLFRRSPAAEVGVVSCVEPGRNRDVVVIGGSAGSLEPIKTITAGLPADLPAAVLVTMHLGADAPSLLAPIIGRGAGMPAVVPRDGDPVKAGYIYVARPDYHLEVGERRMHHGHGPKVNGVRPAIDVMFKSAVATFGPHVVGVVLSGGLDDGSS